VTEINLSLRNHIQKKYLNSKSFKKLSFNFEQVISEIHRDINNNQQTLNILNKNFKFNFSANNLKKFNKFKTITVIGMGGSILGAEAIYGAFKNKIMKKKKIFFLNNLDQAKLISIKKKINLKKTLFIIISKSGNTIETLSNTFALNIIKNNSKNIIIISEKKNNNLYNLSKKFNLFFVEHRKNVGGRYSVLSEVGLIPALLMGVDIKKLRLNILDFLKNQNRKFLKDSTIRISKMLNSKKIFNIIFLSYSTELEKFLYWCQQLIAESLGKKNIGFLPMISRVPKDHHSLLQLYLDGPKDKIFYIFNVREHSEKKIKINHQKGIKSFLNSKNLVEIKNAQREALIKAFKLKEIPFREFNISKLDERVIGKLFSYFILETVIIAKLNRINPFNQPAVEQVKKFTKQILS
tara:strand:- start:1842 stop:3065 length:1224 start_codon:yes stop_codon:yes gene_type:complete